jgi:membrane-associated phospholipid phosphatase
MTSGVWSTQAVAERADHHAAISTTWAELSRAARPRAVARTRRSSARLAALTQVAGLIWLYVIYDAIRAWLTGSASAATHHAEQLLAIERSLGLAVERGWQHAILQVPWLVAFCNLCYSVTHLVVPIVALVVVYRRDRSRYSYWCCVLLAMLGIALLSFWAFPLTPPRLMPSSYGFVDTAQHYFTVTREPLRHALGNYSTPTPGSWGANNPYAAMPSLHLGFAAWSLLALWPSLRTRLSRVLLAAYVPLMLVSVVATGNHWVLDGIGGLVALALAVLFVSASRRLLRSSARSSGREFRSDRHELERSEIEFEGSIRDGEAVEVPL